MSALRRFDPRRPAPERSPAAPNPPKAPNRVANGPATLGGLAALGAAYPAPGPADFACAAEALRRAGNAFSPEALADEAEVTIRGEELP